MDTNGAHGRAVEAGQLVGRLGIIGRAEALVGLVDVAAEGVVLTVGGEHHGHAQPLGLGSSFRKGARDV